MKRALKRLVPFFMAVLVIASIGWYLFVYDRAFTRDVLLSQARHHDTNGNSELASWFYDLAYSYSGQDENVAIELANQYKADGNYTKAEYTLSNAIADGGTADLYIALCKTYVEQDKLLDAVTMLDNIKNPAIKAELDAIRPAAPTADPAPGFYSQYISVALSANDGTIYYTTDGEYPSTGDIPYSDPIAMPAGETTVHTVSVADNGLVSPLNVLGYTISGVIQLVEFTDPAMEASIREILNVSADKTLYTNDLWDITTFTVPQEAASYEDLALLPYLKALTIENKTLDSLSILSPLVHLTKVSLKQCHFPSGDLSILARLPELQQLYLPDCTLSTVSGLAGCPKLTHLDLSDNALNDLSPLSEIPTLKEINLRHNAVTTLSALNTLGSLEKLDVSYNLVNSLSPISTCKNLTWLDASHNSLLRLDGVEQLSALSYFAASHNDLTKIDPLAACLNLTELNISNNTIINIDKLSVLIKLEVLNFSYNQVEYLPNWPEGNAIHTVDGSHNLLRSIDPMSRMTNLTYVYLDYNELNSINAIANLFNLVQVNVYGNPIDDVSALTAHNIIVNYDPT